MSKVRTTLEALERHYTAANLAPGQPLPGVHQEGKSPLVPAEDALIIDSTDLSATEVFERVLNELRAIQVL